MKAKLILPALAETRDPSVRGVKYWRFPPLGRATRRRSPPGPPTT
jgi:hypothetical protein